MKKKNKFFKDKGFTLIELLAVVVILAVILALAVPKIMSMIENSRVRSMESTAKLVAASMEKKYETSLSTGEFFPIAGSTADCMSVIKQYGKDYGTCNYTIDKETGKSKVTITGKDGGKFDGYICKNATKLEATCERQGEVLTYKNVVKNYSGGKSIKDYTVTNRVLCESTFGEVIDKYDGILDLLDFSFGDEIDEMIDEAIEDVGSMMGWTRSNLKSKIKELYAIVEDVACTNAESMDEIKDIADNAISILGVENAGDLESYLQNGIEQFYNSDYIDTIKEYRAVVIEVLISTGIIDEDTFNQFATIEYGETSYCEKGNKIIDYNITNTGVCIDYVNKIIDDICVEEGVCLYGGQYDMYIDMFGDLGFNALCSNETKIEEELPDAIRDAIDTFDIDSYLSQILSSRFDIDVDISIYDELTNIFKDMFTDDYEELLVKLAPRIIKLLIVMYSGELIDYGIIDISDIEKFAEIEYKCANVVTFNANGGTLTSDEVIFIDDYKQIGTLPVPVKEGSMFEGWYTTSTGGDKYTEDTIINKDVTLYAHWTDSEDANVTLTFDPDGGYFINGSDRPNVATFYVTTDNGTLGNEIITVTTSSINDDMERKTDQYDYSDYAPNLNYTDEISIPGAAGLDIDVYYYVERNDMFAIYDSTVKPNIANYNMSVTGLLSNNNLLGIGDDYKSEHYSVGGDTARIFFRSNSNTEEYGYWMTITNKIYTTMHSVSGNASLIPTKKNATFAGWFDENDNEYDSKKGYTKDTTFTARWYNQYTITFNPNGGKVDKTTKTVVYDKYYGELPTPTKEGYSFVGWFTALENGDEITAEDYVDIESDITLYAIWTEGFIVTFDSQGGTCTTSSMIIKTGDYYGVLPRPIKEGYVFKGWFTEETDGEKITSDMQYELSENQTLYAHWDTSYTITFDANGGSVEITTKKVINGKSYGVLPNAKRDNYEFLGWFTDITEGDEITFSSVVTLTEDTTLYAHWESTIEEGDEEEVIDEPEVESDVILSFYTDDEDITFSNGKTVNRVGYNIDTTQNEVLKVVTSRDYNGYTKTSKDDTSRAYRCGDYSCSDIVIIPNVDKVLVTIYYSLSYNSDITIYTYSGDEYSIYGLDEEPSKNYTHKKTLIIDEPEFAINGYISSSDEGEYYGYYIEISEYDENTTFTKTFGNPNLMPVYDGDAPDTWEDESRNVYDPNGIYFEDTSFYPHWNYDRKVFLNANGGTLSQSYIYIDYPGTYGDLPEPTREGYTFDGWYTESVGGKRIYSSTEFDDDSDTSLYAQWRVNADANVTITFDAGDGMFVSGKTNTVKYYYDGSTSELVSGNRNLIPTKAGYSFAGWETSSHEEYDASSTFSEDMTFYAIWVNYITITFDPDGGTCSMTSKTVVYGEEIGYLPMPVKDGYEPMVWYYENGTDMDDWYEIYADYEVDFTEDITVKPYWVKKYNITLDTQGGTVQTSTLQTTYGYYPFLPKAVKAGYVFDGWYTSLDDNGELVESEDEYTSEEDTTLYAKYISAYTVTLDSQGGAITKTKIYTTLGSRYGELPTPVKANNIFEGWYTSLDDSGELVTSKTEYSIEGDSTLYAKYTTIYQITFEPNGGTIDKNSTHTINGEEYGELPTPEKDGYVFIGWYTAEENGTLVTEDTIYTLTTDSTIYALYDRICTVTLNTNGGSAYRYSLTLVNGDEYTYLPTPVKSGYTFIGWFTEDVGSENAIQVTKYDTFTLQEDITLYAYWSSAVSVYLDYNSDEYTNTYIDQNVGMNYNLPTPVSENYKFVGWFTEEVNGEEITSDTIVPDSENITIYAHWTKALGSYTWDEIKEIADKLAQGTLTYNQMVSLYNIEIGDTKKAVINGEKHTFRLVGVNHDVDALGNPLGMTFEQTDIMYDYEVYKEDDDSNSINNWINSDLKKTVESYSIESSLDNVITPAKKASVIYSQISGLQYSTSKLWVMSVAEVSSNYSYAEGTIYEYYSNNSSSSALFKTDLKSSTRSNTYYTYTLYRTPYSNYSAYCIYSYKSVDYRYTSISYVDKDYESGVSVSFCVGSKGNGVVLNTNGGTLTESSEWTKLDDNNYGKQLSTSTYGELPTPTKKAYIFDGWYADSTYLTKVTSSTNVLSKSAHVLYAKWNVDENYDNVHVTFDANGGTFASGSSTNVLKYYYNPNTKGSTITVTTSSLNSDGTYKNSIYDFISYDMWYVGSSQNITIPNASELSVKIYHATIYKDNIYLYSCSNGNCNTLVSTIYGSSNNDYSPIYTNVQTSTIQGDTVKIQFSVNSSSSYYRNYGYWAEISANDCGEYIKLSGNDKLKPTRDGYAFDKWVDENGDEYTVSKVYTEDTTFTAVWNKVYTVTFDTQKSGYSVSSKEVINTKIYGELTYFDDDEYEFVGWFTEKEGGTRIYGYDTVNLTNDITLYGHWNKKFKLTADSNGGVIKSSSSWDLSNNNTISTKTIINNHNYGTLPYVTREGYAFKGWFTEKEGGTQITYSSTVNLTSDQTIYAHWEEVTPSVANDFISNILSDSSNGLEVATYDSDWNFVSSNPTYTEYRYTGNSPNNYVTFNGETWRIIGMFKDNAGDYQLKIIRQKVYNSVQWAYNSNKFSSSYIKNYLIDFYNNDLSVSSKEMIDSNAVFNINAISTSSQNVNSEYIEEKTLTTTGFDKTYTNSAANVGLPTLSDSGYALTSNCWKNHILSNSSDYNCYSSWFTDLNYNEHWSANAYSNSSSYVYILYYHSSSYGWYDYYRYYRPVVYLKSSVQIISGSGASGDPYILG